MTQPRVSIHRLSGAEPHPPALYHALSEALALRTTGALEGETLEIVQTLATLFPDMSPISAAAAGLLLQAPADGHTCLDANALHERWKGRFAAPTALHNTPPSADAIRAALRANSDLCAPWNAEQNEAPPNTPLVHAFDRFYLHRAAVTEHGISGALRPRIHPSHAVPQSVHARLSLLQKDMHADQSAAVRTAMAHDFMLLTGGPGTGKTWTVRVLLAMTFALAYAKGRPAPRIVLAAPTGKAAARMLESLHANLDAFMETIGLEITGQDATQAAALRAFLDALEAQTLHRLLRVYSRQNTPHYVHADLVIVDEVSMVDAPMMHRLLTSLDTASKLLLIGDPHQLASVEAGSVLADLVTLSERTPDIQKHVVQLTHSHRFTKDSLVGKLAHATLHQKPNDEIWTQALTELMPEQPLPDAQIASLAEGFLPLLQAAHAAHPPADEQPEALNARAQKCFQMINDFQILCAHHRGPRSVLELNETITRALTQRGAMQSQGTAGLSVGMPIMILRNDYNLGRYNGDIGVVTTPNTVSFPTEDGGVQHIAPARLPEHRLAFAITVHKSQGSEWRDVRVLLPPNPSRILTRELLYTAISRAKTHIEILGDAQTLRAAIERKADRATGLVDVISAQL